MNRLGKMLEERTFLNDQYAGLNTARSKRHYLS